MYLLTCYFLRVKQVFLNCAKIILNENTFKNSKWHKSESSGHSWMIKWWIYSQVHVTVQCNHTIWKNIDNFDSSTAHSLQPYNKVWPNLTTVTQATAFFCYNVREFEDNPPWLAVWVGCLGISHCGVPGVWCTHNEVGLSSRHDASMFSVASMENLLLEPPKTEESSLTESRCHRFYK